MLNNKKMWHLLKISFLIICVSSKSLSERDGTENNENSREGRQINGDSYDTPIDLHDQLQSLGFMNNDKKNDEQLPPHNSWRDLVPGIPGVDYPSLDKIPDTSFSCAEKTPGGYYADVETGCQVFHICNIGGFKSSFLCPEGSIFNQRYYVCDWWYGFQCNDAISLYPENKKNNNEEESNDNPVSDTIDNYESITLQNNNNPEKDLASASSGEGGAAYKKDRLLNENQRQSFNHNEQRIIENNNNINRKFNNQDYIKDEEFQNYTIQNIDRNEKLHENLKKNSDKNEKNDEVTVKEDKNGDEIFHDTVPRGFAFNRGTSRRNIYRKASQIPRQAPPLHGYSNFSEKSQDSERTQGYKDATENTSTNEEIRYVPAL